MAYVANLDLAYDVFVSFAYTDNQRFGTTSPPWVDRFVGQLEKTIQQQLGKKDVDIFFDRYSLEAGRPLASELVRCAGSSAIFVAITSPSYVNEDSWCLDELRAFEKAGRRAGRSDQRIFPIELLPLDDEEHYPAVVRKLTRSQFWRPTTRDRVPAPIRPDTRAFYERVWGLGDQIARHLKSMRSVSGPSHRQSNLINLPPLPAALRGRPIQIDSNLIEFGVEPVDAFDLHFDLHEVGC
jgi:hypothetical protein